MFLAGIYIHIYINGIIESKNHKKIVFFHIFIFH